MLKSAVINNLVPADKRDILFNTQTSDISDDSMENDPCKDKICQLEDRLVKLELMVKKLVEYLVKESEKSD